MDIVKQLNRNVTFSRSGIIIQTLKEDCTAVLNGKRNGIIITDLEGKKVEIFTRQIENTQFLPAASVKFQPGNTVDLWNLLFDPNASPFFNELHMLPSRDSGGVIQSNWTTVNVGTYTALITDYQLKITANTTITLPTIAVATIGRVYRFYTGNYTATIQRGGTDLFVDGATSFVLKKYEAITLRACDASTWVYGD